MTIRQQIQTAFVSIETSTRAKNFCEMARYFAFANGVWDNALKNAKKDGAPLPVINAIKSVVDAGSTTSLSPLAPYRQLQDAFVLSLRQFSCFDRMLPFFRALPAHRQIAVVSGGATAATTDEIGTSAAGFFAVHAEPNPREENHLHCRNHRRSYAGGKQ